MRLGFQGRGLGAGAPGSGPAKRKGTKTMTTKKNELVAVYGTLLEGERNAHWGNGALSRRKASVRGVLYDTGYSFPALVPEDTAGLVEAEVLEVDAKGLAKMDVLEGYPRLYRRDRVTATFEDGGEAEVWVYVMNKLPEHATVIANGSWRRRNEKPVEAPVESVAVEIDRKTLEAAHAALCALLDAVEGVLSETGDIRRYCANPAKVLGKAERAKDDLAEALGEKAGKPNGRRAKRKNGR